MSTPTERLAMPYPGLRPFEPQDQPLFFGREAQIAAMLRQLEDHRFVAVVGASGSGKSSLVRAGLLPAIHEGFLHGSRSWLSLIIKPGHQPYKNLAIALLRGTQPGDQARVTATDQPPQASESAIVEVLRRTDRGLLEALALADARPDIKVMVVIDQFEELFAFRRATASRDEVASRDESAAFVRMLLCSSSPPKGSVWVVLTMRSDFIGDCEAFLGLPEAVSRSQFLVPRLDREQMEDAICRPAEATGAAFRPFSFAEGLVNLIINDAGDRPDQLPLLQHALMRTWKFAEQRCQKEGGTVELTHEDYEKAGGIEEALSRDADAAWQDIANDPRQALIARRMFLLLCDVSPDGQITRRRPRVAEVEDITDSSVIQIKQVVRVFQDDDRNFLLPARGEDLLSEQYLDVSHEALLRQWGLFANDWLVQERGDVDELRSLVKQANDRLEGKGGCLGEQDLRRIWAWRKRVSPQWALRYVTQNKWDALLAFIQESEKEVERQRTDKARQVRLRQRLLWALGSILVAATLISFGFGLSARRARNRARAEAVKADEMRKAVESALVRSFVRTIGTLGYWKPSADEREALWELAELESANQNVREEVIRHWMRTEDSLPRALLNDYQGLHAAIGLNKSLRTFFDAHTTDAIKVLTEALVHPKGPDSDDKSDLVKALKALAQWMDPHDVATVAEGLTNSLQTAYLDGADIYLARAGTVLAALAARMNTNDAAILAGASVLAQALSNSPPKMEPIYHPWEVCEALAALAARMNTNEAAILAERGASVLATLLEKPGDTGYDIVMGHALAGLAARMSPSGSATLAARLSRALAPQGLPEGDAWTRLLALREGLVAVAGRMDPNDASTVAAGLANALQNVNFEKADHPMRLLALGEGLAASVAGIPTNAASVLATRGASVLVAALERFQRIDYDERASMGNVLAKLAARMDTNAAASLTARVASDLIPALENPQKEVSYFELTGIGRALGDLATCMDPHDAAKAAVRLLTTLTSLNREKASDRAPLPALGEALAGLAGRLDPKDAATLASFLVLEVLKAQAQDSSRLTSLRNALMTLAQRMDPNDAARVAADLVDVLKHRHWFDIYHVSVSGSVLAALAERMNTNDAAILAERGASVLAQALSNPEKEDFGGLSDMGEALAALAAQIPKAERTQIVALSFLFLTQVPAPPRQGKAEAHERITVAKVCALLTTQQLAEVLKWPFCVGEAQNLVLVELEHKTNQKFGGDVWNFVQQVDSHGIQGLNSQFLDLPAKRPHIEDAIMELEDLTRRSVKEP